MNRTLPACLLVAGRAAASLGHEVRADSIPLPLTAQPGDPDDTGEREMERARINVVG